MSEEAQAQLDKLVVMDDFLSMMNDLKAMRIARETGVPVEEVRQAIHEGCETQMRAFVADHPEPPTDQNVVR